MDMLRDKQFPESGAVGFMKRYLLILAFLPLFVPDLSGQEKDLPVFNNEFWFFSTSEPELTLDAKTPEEKEREAKQKIEDILEEAVFVYSGMIYGFSFTYTPGDIKRDVAEIFEITPASVIRRGDPALKVRNTRREGARTFIEIEYRCEERHGNWIAYWMSTSFASAGGSGEGSAEAGFEGKKDAVVRAVKETIRNYMRNRVHNKPRAVSGNFVFEKPPVITYLAGLYYASARIRLEIREVESYTVF